MGWVMSVVLPIRQAGAGAKVRQASSHPSPGLNAVQSTAGGVHVVQLPVLHVLSTSRPDIRPRASANLLDCQSQGMVLRSGL